jgi:HrpA-like RNA helicase
MQPFADPPFKLFDKIGILDPEGLNVNPLTGNPYENLHKGELTRGKKQPSTYAQLAKETWEPLGVYKRSTDILKTLNNYQIVCAKSGTGSGKTVIFPKYALHVGGYKKRVLCAIPKKLITKSGAAFAARVLDVHLGEEVGYMYKGEREVSVDKTMLTFTTTGSVNALIKRDELLSNYDYLVIDEAHERSSAMDMLLLFVKQMVMKRSSIKIIIMSATIDLEVYRRYFTDPHFKFSFATLNIEGDPTYPRSLVYRAPHQFVRKGTDKKVIEDGLVAEIASILDRPPLRHDKKLTQYIITELKKSKKYKDTSNPVEDNINDGDIIAFVPAGSIGVNVCEKLKELQKTKPQWQPFFCTTLEAKSANKRVKDAKGVEVLKSDGKPATEEYYATDENAYKKHPTSDPQHPFTRKIVLTTEVAESSVTINGATYVIETAVKYESSFFPQTLSSELAIKFIARDAIMQRQGRIGRTEPGVVYHMYTEEQFNNFADITTPDMRKIDLTSEILEIMAMPGKDSIQAVRDFFLQLIEPPKDIFLESAVRTLHSLGAITSTAPHGRRNMFGRAMSYFRSPITPAQAKCLIISKYYNCSREMSQLVALLDALGGKEINMGMLADPKKGVSPFLVSKYGDHLTLLHAYQRYAAARDKYAYCKTYNLKMPFFANVEEMSTKINNTVETLFEREDDLVEIDETLIVDEMNMVSGKNKKKLKQLPGRVKRSGGTFHVTDAFELTGVNTSGARDLDIIFALYPDSKSIKGIADAILKQDDPSSSTSSIDAEKAQALIMTRIQRYHPTSFGALSVEQQKKVVSALSRCIHARESEQARILEAHEAGVATNSDVVESRGHKAWIHNLKVFRQHAQRKLNREHNAEKIMTRRRVAEELYQHIEDLPEDFYAHHWSNVEDRLMRVLFEGYYTQSAVRFHPSEKVYHSVFPMQSTSALISKESSLCRFPKLKEDLCIFETIFSFGGTSFCTVSTLPSKVRKNKEVQKILQIMFARAFPKETLLKVSQRNSVIRSDAMKHTPKPKSEFKSNQNRRFSTNKGIPHKNNPNTRKTNNPSRNTHKKNNHRGNNTRKHTKTNSIIAHHG